MSKIVDKNKFNAECGEWLAYNHIIYKHKNRWSLYRLQNNFRPKRETIYTNWFYFKDPYPNADTFIPSHKL